MIETGGNIDHVHRHYQIRPAEEPIERPDDGRVLMAGGKWLVPPEQRPSIPVPPDGPPVPYGAAVRRGHGSSAGRGLKRLELRRQA